MNRNEMKSMTVNTRRGPIYFQSNLTWEDACTTLINITERTDFISSLVDRIQRDQYMSDAQCSWVYYLAEQTWAPKRNTKAQQSVMGDEILAALAQAKANGLKRPTIQLNKNIRVKFMANGKNANGAWITFTDELIGKIDCNGEAFAFDNAYISCDDLLQIISNFNNNFEDKIRAQGVQSGKCMCCGLPLTNELSMRLGIGPICREKYFG